MSITKSYNKHTDTYYAYETSYVWDEKAQRKVQKRICIGQYDPETGEIIPNAKRGRPSKQKTEPTAEQQSVQEKNRIDQNLAFEISAAIAELNELESSISALQERFHQLKERMLSLHRIVSESENELS